MKSKARAPIGVFDSGLGGLTVLRALRELLPYENFIYLGDTARVPYGARSPAIVERYSREVSEWLLRHGARMIVIACNTATAHAGALLKKELHVPVVGVIEPGVRALLKYTRNKRVGVIGTRSTIKSAAYSKLIGQLAPDVRVFARACPLFVPLVEEGWIDKRITGLVIQEYLSEMVREEVDSIVLGCTHYPLLKEAIQAEYPRIDLIDSSQEIARAVQQQLTAQAAVDCAPDEPGKTRIYLTDGSENMNYLENLLSGLPVEHFEVIQI